MYTTLITYHCFQTLCYGGPGLRYDLRDYVDV